MDSLTFLTITSGDVQQSPLAAVAADVLARLRPLVIAGGGPVPGQPGWTFRLTHVEGGAFFSIGQGQNLATAGAVAYTNEGATELWEAVESIHLNSYQSMVKLLKLQNVPDNWLSAPEQPTALPWLAVSLQPGLLANPTAAFWLGDFERCLAWAVIQL